MLILIKYSYKVCVISFGFYSTHYKVYIHLPCINTQRKTTEPFDMTHVISSSDHQTPILYQGPANRCEWYRNHDIICLLQLSQIIHYCNQSELEIVPDLHIFDVFVIAIVTGKCTVLLLQKYNFKVCVVSFDFWSSCLKVYINLCCINTHQKILTSFP